MLLTEQVTDITARGANDSRTHRRRCYRSSSHWRRTGGSTIERWNLEGAPPDAHAIADTHGRLMVVMVHNSDIPDPWEREGEDTDYFFKFSPEAYAVGIDVVLYAMTH